MTRTNPWFEMDVNEDDEPEPARPTRSWLDRLTRSAAFRVLLGLTLLLALPILLLGIVGLPFMLPAIFDAPDPWILLPIAAILGGVAGMLGPLRSPLHGRAARPTSTRLTLVMLATGVVTAVAMIVGIVVAFATTGPRWNAFAVLPLASIAGLAILSVKGAAEIDRLRRRASRDATGTAIVGIAAARGAPGRAAPDTLPWILLAAAVVQLLAAAAVNVAMA